MYNLKEGITPVEKYRLTPRQIEVLRYLALGLQNKQIAYEMGISIATVKLHLNGIYTRLRVNNRVQALLRAREEHII
ncbi:MAG: response regulator transcription factor [Alphaproteobacteria bacterium]|nr:response regulator transcription factor [Alphaproteobacteria bacterium]